jgi:5-methylcytosine-specific restriction endonuclease McrBC GTP-binding regulatory subunit McrB
VAQAILNPESNFVLVIEEINRADAASVFGDAFQMLDRDQAGASNYPCTLADEAMAFLRSRGIDQLQIGIPNNLYLWATMNSADQGVMPLDSAFKRRWSFEYMPLDKFATETQDWVIDLSFIDGSIRWNQVRDKINSKLIDNSVPEDRLIGPFFMTEGELNHNGFKNKLLMYLHDDVLRDDPSILFKDETLSAVFKSYDAGQSVFTFEL